MLLDPVPAEPPEVIVVMPLKSVRVAALLSLMWGPVGMLYSTVSGAVVMLVLNLAVGQLTMGFGLILTWPGCAVWACIAVKKHNFRLVELCTGRRW